jgi:predicted nuclease of predicted toxin-antitoxin system
MQRYLIDVNLPRIPAVWPPDVAVHLLDLQSSPIAGWTDTQIWEHARLHGFTIVTKDADFTNRVLVSEQPARVIHIRFGNVRLTGLRQIIEGRWPRIAKLSREYRIVDVYRNRTEQRR